MTKKQEESMDRYYVHQVTKGVMNTTKIIKTNLTREEAIELVNQYPDSNETMVIFTKL
jgi:hypothetical protein